MAHSDGAPEERYRGKKAARLHVGEDLRSIFLFVGFIFIKINNYFVCLDV